MLNTLKLLIVLLFVSPMAFADNLPTMHQIYQTAESGKLNDAQRMIEQVLQVHPDSGKAHFVNAEILAKEGNFARAQTELDTAERLSPGLSFAKPQSVQNLKQRLAAGTTTSGPSNMLTQSAPASAKPFPWAMLIFGVVAVLLLMWGVKALFSRKSRGNQPMMNGNNPVANYNSGAPGNPGNPNGYGGAPNNPGQAGGMGSGIMSGLATGAAVGVGMVAGEALMHRFTDGSNANAATNNNAGNFAPDNNVQQQDDMGGSDFGVTDTSWDDSSSDPGDDSW